MRFLLVSELALRPFPERVAHDHSGLAWHAYDICQCLVRSCVHTLFDTIEALLGRSIPRYPACGDIAILTYTMWAASPAVSLGAQPVYCWYSTRVRARGLHDVAPLAPG